MEISFRPHHFLCTLGFQGKGYSSHFIENFARIVDTLSRNEDHPIRVIGGLDSICAACPRHENGMCEVEEDIQSLDQRHADILSLSQGQQITWADTKKRLKERMTLEAFHRACEGCSWKSLGVCEAALKSLKENTHGEKAHP